jgi:hypothetical protein
MPMVWGVVGLYAGLKILLLSGAVATPMRTLVGFLCLLQSAAAMQLVVRFVQRRWRWSHFGVWAVAVSSTLLAFAANVRSVPERPTDNPFFWIGGIPLFVGGAALMLRLSREADKRHFDGPR